MWSLAYLVAFILMLIVIGGPIALGLTFLRLRRYRTTVTISIISIIFAVISSLLGIILLLNSGGVASKILGIIGLGTGIPAIRRSIRKIRDFR
jgi:ABC-type sugar transport system permease subunit